MSELNEMDRRATAGESVPPEEESPPRRPRGGGLRGNRSFQLLWTGSAISLLGLEAADIAYPLTILAITSSPGWTGLFGAVQLIAALIAGLPAGDVLDRHNPRQMLIAAEVVRLIATGGVAVVIWAGYLSVWYLLGTAVILGAVLPFSSAARMLILRSVVPPEDLTAALTRDEVRTASAMLAGPPLGAALFNVARVLPFATIAISFLASTLTAMFLRLPAPASAAGPDPAEAGSPGYFTRTVAGLKAVWADVTLRTTVVLIAAINTAAAPLVLVVIVVLRQQHTAPWIVGLTISALAAGGLAGAGLVKPLHRLVAPGALLLLLGAFEAALFALLALPWGAAWIAVMLFSAMLGVPALRVLVDVLIFRQVQPALRGRVVAGVMTLFTLGAPLGIGISGLLLSNLAARTVLFVLAAALAVTVAVALSSRTLRGARWPEEAAPQ